ILMFILPLLGWVTLSAEGDPIPFFGLELPALVAPNESLAGRTEDLHKTLGTAGYYLIALHARAALYHHYLRRDNTLRRMMLSRGRTEPEPLLRGRYLDLRKGAVGQPSVTLYCGAYGCRVSAQSRPNSGCVRSSGETLVDLAPVSRARQERRIERRATFL